MLHRHNRQLGWGRQNANLWVGGCARVRFTRQHDVVLNRVAELGCPVRLETEPQFERAQRARVFERDVNRVRVLRVVRHVGLVVTERCGEGRVVTHEHNRAGFGHEHPLVRIDSD